MPVKNVLVVGSSNTDMTVRLPRIPGPGETILGRAFAMAGGGKGANQAVSAARAGGGVTFIARVGEDVFGAEALSGLKAGGIDVRFVTRDPALPSGVALISVADDGENAISVAPGANAALTPDDILRAETAFDGTDIVLLQLETPVETVLAAAGLARKRGIPVILNPAPARPLDDGLLASVSILTPNASEAALLAGVETASAAGVRLAAAALRGRGPRLVIVTLGDKGCYAVSKDFDAFVPAFNVRAVDTTAAGDVFNGSLAVALAEGMGLADALRFSSAAAALSVTKPGAQPSAPSRSEIEAFLVSAAG
jgi:ribokinase